MDIQSVQDMQAKHTKELDRLTNVMKGMELGYQDRIDKLRYDVERILPIAHHNIIQVEDVLNLIDKLKDGE